MASPYMTSSPRLSVRRANYIYATKSQAFFFPMIIPLRPTRRLFWVASRSHLLRREETEPMRPGRFCASRWFLHSPTTEPRHPPPRPRPPCGQTHTHDDFGRKSCRVVVWDTTCHFRTPGGHFLFSFLLFFFFFSGGGGGERRCEKVGVDCGRV